MLASGAVLLDNIASEMDLLPGLLERMYVHHLHSLLNLPFLTFYVRVFVAVTCELVSK